MYYTVWNMWWIFLLLLSRISYCLFSSLTMIHISRCDYLGIDVCWVSFICRLMCFIKFGTFSAIIFKTIFSAFPLFCHTGILKVHLLKYFNCLVGLWGLCSSFLKFCFISNPLMKIVSLYLQFQWFFPLPSQIYYFLM